MAALDPVTNIRNIWDSNIFDNALKRLLLIYFRAKFASIREKRFKDLLVKRSAEAAKKREEKQKLSRNTNWQRRWKEKCHMQKCLTRIESANNPVEKAEWEKSLRLANERLREMARNTQ